MILHVSNTLGRDNKKVLEMGENDTIGLMHWSVYLNGQILIFVLYILSKIWGKNRVAKGYQ